MYVYTYTQVALYLQYIGERLCVFKCVTAYFKNKQVHTPIYRTLVYACIYPHFFFFFLSVYHSIAKVAGVYSTLYVCIYNSLISIHMYKNVCRLVYWQ